MMENSKDEEVLKKSSNEALDVSQRFKLACAYMMVSNICDLRMQLTDEERTLLLDVQDAHVFPEYRYQLPKVWTRHLQSPLGGQLFVVNLKISGRKRLNSRLVT